MGDLRLTRSYHFSAGHRLENPALGEEENARIYGPCYRQHGHNYLLEVTVGGELDPVTGMSADLAAVDAAVEAAVLSRVDHYDLSATVPELSGVITTVTSCVLTPASSKLFFRANKMGSTQVKDPSSAMATR